MICLVGGTSPVTLDELVPGGFLNESCGFEFDGFNIFLFAVPDSRLEPALILLVGGYRTKSSSTSVFCFRVLISNLPVVFLMLGYLTVTSSSEIRLSEPYVGIIFCSAIASQFLLVPAAIRLLFSSAVEF